MIRFILDNIIDTSELTTSLPVDPDYIVDNIKKISRGKSLRTLGTPASIDIKGTLSDSKSVSALVLSKHNFSENITFELELYTSSDWTGTPVYDSGPTVMHPKEIATDLYQWGEFDWGSVTWGANKTDVDKRQFYDAVLWLDNVYTGINSYIIRLAIITTGSSDYFFCNEESIFTNRTDLTCNLVSLTGGVYNIFFVSNPTIRTTTQIGDPLVYIRAHQTTLDTSTEIASPGVPYYEIGRVYLGEYLEPSYNISKDHILSWNENTKQYRASSGTLRSDYATTNRTFEFALKTIPDSDRVDLHKKLVDKGKRDDFYVSIFPNDSSKEKEIDYSGPVKINKVPKYTEFISGYSKATFSMEEI